MILADKCLAQRAVLRRWASLRDLLPTTAPPSILRIRLREQPGGPSVPAHNNYFLGLYSGGCLSVGVVGFEVVRLNERPP